MLIKFIEEPCSRADSRYYYKVYYDGYLMMQTVDKKIASNYYRRLLHATKRKD